MWWSNPVIVVVVLQLLVCSALNQRLIGGQEPLTAEDYQSETFNQLLNEANAECNKRTEDRYWYKIDAVLDGTKQVVSGIKYVFRIRQRPTECEKEVVLKQTAGQPESACSLRQSDQTIRLCTVDVWHQPWLPNPRKITLKSIWHVETLDKLFSEIHTRINLRGSEWEQRKPDVEEAVLRYNLQNASQHVYKLAELDLTLTQNRADPTQILTVHLDETECQKVNSLADHDVARESACYNETTLKALICHIRINRPEQAPRITNCEAPRQAMRGMWRLSGIPEGTKTCDAPTMLSDPGLSNHFSLHNVARSNVRLLTSDEVHTPKIREIAQVGVREDNIRNNNHYLFAFHAVKYARLQTTPKPVYKMRIALRPTNCTKNQGYLDDPERFEAECQSTRPNTQYRTCLFTIPWSGKEEEMRHLFEVDECKHDLPFKMLGARAHLPEAERQAENFQSMLMRVVEKYNQESNSSYVFELHKADNVEHQTVQGKLYTMNITMKATRFKEGSNEKEMSNVNETLLHCQARVWQQPWIQSEAINLTNCWKSVRLLQPIHSSWNPVTLEDMKRAGVSFLLTERVRVPNQVLPVDHEFVIDHVTNAFLVEVKYKKLYTFDVQLRDTENSSQTFMCKVMQPAGVGGFKNQAPVIYDCKSKPSAKGPNLLGAPKRLDENDLQSVEFQEKMEHVTEVYNQVQNDLYYYNYAGVQNASKQLVSGIKTVAFVYLERTSCQKGKHEYLRRSKRHSLCGTGPDTHRRAMLCEVHVLEKLHQSPANVQIKECTTVPPSELRAIHPFIPEVQHTSTYRRVVNLAVLAYNLYRNHSVFYRLHHVENFNRSLKDAAKSEFQFDLVMRPTKCMKWNETLLYLNKNYKMCTKTVKLDVVSCKAKVVLMNRVPSVELDECEHIHVRPVEDPRPMSQKETSDPEFHKLVDMSVKLFNSRIRSPFWYELVHVENPMVGYASGRYQTFDLHMVSTKCRVEEIEATTPEAREKKCGPVDTKFLVSCSVRAWTRDWSPDHRTLDLTVCRVTPSTAFADSRNRGHLRMRHEHCVQSVLPKLVKLFNAQNNLSVEYGDPMIDNIEERMLPGTKLDFDIYFKPKLQENTCTVSGGSDTGCMKNHFYTCKASIWIRPLRNREEFELVNCARIQPILLGETDNDPTSSLEHIKRKAVQLYNTKLAQNYEYGLMEISNVTHKTDFGVRTAFNLVLRPTACQKNAGAQLCQSDLSEIRVNCHVTLHQHPWLPESETLLLTNCFQRFGANWVDGEGDLTAEEQNSEEFKQMVTRLSELHRPQSPIIYGVKRVQNTKFHSQSGWRNITLELVFQPIGCNRSDEVSYQIHCLDPTKQDEMICDGLIAENKSSFGMKHLYLSNCRENWKTESPRPMTQTEQESHWFQESVKSAWHLQLDVPIGTNLYTVTSIKEPIIETAQDRKITYTMTLSETECVKNRDEYQFVNGKSEQCPIKANPVKKTCMVNYTLSRDGKYTLNIRCHT